MNEKFSPALSSYSTTPSPSDYDDNDISIGCQLFVDINLEKSCERGYRKAEVLNLRKVKKESGEDEKKFDNEETEIVELQYYVHFVEFNKRLDEWVSIDRLDFSRPIEPPRASLTPINGTTPPNLSIMSPNVGSPLYFDSPALSPSPSPVSHYSITKEQELEKLRHGGGMSGTQSHLYRVRNIEKIQIGRHTVSPWYFSPYPQEFCELPMIFICEFCLSYFGNVNHLKRHLEKCKLMHPPGNEIYHADNPKISFFEIDGHQQKTYCRNLCLLSKLFLDHKTLYYDVDPFLFYVMCIRDSKGCHLIGHFSKEKDSQEGHNLACILTLPQYQRQGYGRLLISFSYELSKVEGKIGTPEKPLSDLGLLSYRAYWSETIFDFLLDKHEHNEEISIQEIAEDTKIATPDILQTLQSLGMLRTYRGQQVILLSDSVLAAHKKAKKKNQFKIDTELLQWSPPRFTATQLRYAY
ncbi:hypothetical protein G9A89_019442 [Geosiphon pyriformis]|nr:hypothetical protein G9A89_019442 [Geosiphon pyriformis]